MGAASTSRTNFPKLHHFVPVPEVDSLAEAAVRDQMTHRRFLAELLFQVLTKREEKNSLAIASNEAFSGWAKTFTDPRLCAAIVDRLTFGGTIIETGTDSYRLAQTRARDHAAG